jgi:hypothetical protein
MLAYRIIRYLQTAWQGLDCTVQEGLQHLDKLWAQRVHITGQTSYRQMPQPDAFAQRLLDAADVRLPKRLPKSLTTVATKQTQSNKQ